MLRHAVTAILVNCLLASLAPAAGRLAAAESVTDIPAPLEPWRGWVLHDVADIGCPSPYDDGGIRLPLWPSELAVAADADGGSWDLTVRAFAESWLPLPGDADTWPEDVLVDGAAVPVVARDDRPAIRLEAGLHRVSGRFVWQTPPERIAVPPSIGMVTLTREGDEVRLPDRDAAGLLWLRRARAVEEQQDQISGLIYRVLEDGLPLWLRTELELTVSGTSREEDLGCVLPAGWQLSFVDGPIPVAIDAAGRLRAQVRAGNWRIQLDAFRTEDTRELAYAPDTTPAVAAELIALRARPDLRATEFEGVPPVDVNLTTFPESWRSLPVFRWETAAPLRWIVKASGGGLRQPDRFQVTRQLWLDDDGRGMTFEDTINGECRTISRLDAAEGHRLEVVRIGGERQLITRRPETAAAGVELRAPRPAIQAIGRTERAAAIAAIGWQADAERLSATFSLPPGWRMLALFGADHVDGDWLTAWTLLDLFLLLVFTVGVFRMQGFWSAALAFLAFGLAYHESGSPRFTWLFLLAPVALLRVTRSQYAGWWAGAWKLVALGLLLVHLVPFVAGELQSAVFPQLEPECIHYRQRGLLDILGVGMRRSSPRFDLPGGVPATSSAVESERGKELYQRGREAMMAGVQLQTSNMQFAPGTRTQTGIAKPAWDGNRVVCRWDGPVDSGQTLRPILIPAWMNRILAVIRVGLLVLLLRSLLCAPPHSSRRRWQPPAPAALPLMGLVCIAASGQPAAAQEFPSTELLDKLRGRLLETAEAFPHAAEIPTASLTIEAGRVRLEAEVHAAVACGVPLPGRLPAWSPLSVTTDGEAATVVRRDDGYLWVWLEQGVHRLVVEGVLPDATEWVWNAQLLPRRMTVVAADWNVRGLAIDGRPDGPLFFTRREAAEAGEAVYDQRHYKSVVEVDRVLEIGLVWKVHTTVRRRSEPGQAIALRVPLLAGERVLTGRGDGPEGVIEVTLPADGNEFAWESELPITSEISLRSQAGPEWVERWSVVPSPVWNLRAHGLEPIYEEAAETLVPVWHPWPGESVTLLLARPEAVEGRTLTIQSAHRRLDLGSRRRNGFLALDLESSLGGECAVGLPDDASVNAVRLDGRSLPIRRADGRVIVPLQPGRQKLELEWARDLPLSARAAFDTVSLPVDAANLTSEMRVPESRWILWAAGPIRGPAVRFWAILAVAVVLGFVLGRVPHSPLATHAWVLLLVGLTQVSVFAAAVVVGWLFLLSRRGRQDPAAGHWLLFDLTQLFIVGVTIAALITLVVVVNRGLLGRPEMFITGNGSFSNRLVWFTPQGPGDLDRPWVVTVSIWWYRLLMLLWGLWLANAVTRWLVVGWRQFTAGGAWRWRGT